MPRPSCEQCGAPDAKWTKRVQQEDGTWRGVMFCGAICPAERALHSALKGAQGPPEARTLADPIIGKTPADRLVQRLTEMADKTLNSADRYLLKAAAQEVFRSVEWRHRTHELLERTLQTLDAFIHDHQDPGTEAFAVRWCLSREIELLRSLAPHMTQPGLEDPDTVQDVVEQFLGPLKDRVHRDRLWRQLVTAFEAAITQERARRSIVANLATMIYRQTEEDLHALEEALSAYGNPENWYDPQAPNHNPGAYAFEPAADTGDPGWQTAAAAYEKVLARRRART